MRRPKQRTVGILAVALAVGTSILFRYAGGALLRRRPVNSPPPQEQRLSDGTILALEAVTYGRQHSFPHSQRMMQPTGIGDQRELLVSADPVAEDRDSQTDHK
jgi:hypothetical protein